MNIMSFEGLHDATYYKYGSLNNFERFVDIVLKKRLYGALYQELNDPMEGKFNREKVSEEQRGVIKAILNSTRICSLMMKTKEQYPDNFLMWSHYADGHRGCCYEIGITKRNNSQWELLQVQYKEQLPRIVSVGKDAVRNIISTKSKLWEEEHEVRAIRIFDTKQRAITLSPYYAVNLKAIFIGAKVSPERRDSIKRIVQSIDNRIAVYRMKEDYSDFGLYPRLVANKL